MSATLAACDAACRNETIANIASPSGRLRAVVFSRNCGATTGFNTQLSIVSAGNANPADGGNAFIAKGTATLKIEWASEAELVVYGSHGLKTFKQERHVDGVVISYR